MGMTGITEEQVNHYRLFGYVVLPGLVTGHLRDLDSEFDRLTDADAHDGKSRKLVWQFLDHSPVVSPLLEEFGEVFEAVLGDDWQYFGSVGNIYSGDTGWHTDNYAHHHRAKLALYLDPTGPGRGGLSLLPLSHRVAEEINEVHLSVGMSVKSLGLTSTEIPCLTVTTEPGDGLLFNHNLLHASFGGGAKRRMISVNAHAHYRDDERATLESDVARLSRFLAPAAYGPDIAGDPPAARTRHLEQVLSCSAVYEEALRRKLATTSTKAKDPLPDLSLNTDPKVAIAELLRDNDYVAPAAWLAGAAG